MASVTSTDTYSRSPAASPTSNSIPSDVFADQDTCSVPNVLILFGSELGTTEKYAFRFAEYLRAVNFSCISHFHPWSIQASRTQCLLPLSWHNGFLKFSKSSIKSTQLVTSGKNVTVERGQTEPICQRKIKNLFVLASRLVNKVMQQVAMVYHLLSAGSPSSLVNNVTANSLHRNLSGHAYTSRPSEEEVPMKLQTNDTNTCALLSVEVKSLKNISVEALLSSLSKQKSFDHVFSSLPLENHFSSYLFNKMTVRDINGKCLSHQKSKTEIPVSPNHIEDRKASFEPLIVFLVATHIHGAPTSDALAFFQELKDMSYDFRVEKTILENIRYTVVGFGSRDYPESSFCRPAKHLDKMLRRLGAVSIGKSLEISDSSDETSGKPSCDWMPIVGSYLFPHLGKIQSCFLSKPKINRITTNSVEDLPHSKFPSDTPPSEAFKMFQTPYNDAARIGKFHDGYVYSPFMNTFSLLSALFISPLNFKAFSQEKEDFSSLRLNKPPLEQKEPPIASTDHFYAETGKIVSNQLCGKSADDVVKHNSDSELESEASSVSSIEDDLEDIGNSFTENLQLETTRGQSSVTPLSSNRKLAPPQEMLNEKQSSQLKKEGYKLVGTHSAVKLCRWTKAQLRGRGGCYKHTFYGIISYQCMEATPSLACANKCVFCWRHHKNPVGTEWKWKTDDPIYIVEEAIKSHVKMIHELKEPLLSYLDLSNCIKTILGMQGVLVERYEAAHTVRHCALSLVGEPIMYPKINVLLEELHHRRISTFLVTNAQLPEAIMNLIPVTQLYVSVDAADKESLKRIDRPLFKDFWERFLNSLDALREKRQRTVYRLTIVKDYNMKDVELYAKLIDRGRPDFIEMKAVTFCGTSKGSNLTMKNVPWHEEVINFGEKLCHLLENEYEVACEHKHSCCIVLAKKCFKLNGQWHTWIDYDKFHELVSEKGRQFSALDYCAPTPNWALFSSIERGFDPAEKRVYTKGKFKNSGA
ncbi:radical SAM domain-containing protein [Cardiosporidium cionae]|uniref:tRNA 4-demethylwyosine synthase (AdoMet-dependent) n=1 Tax=Cardiosporidium cionae TaxID=476202 RepID=A0ABQ7J718_9APIC|nr:radical SAM domain-containing protein [Cardiosporidium cionae]|eukprot:KAF8819793.1 radical SAM domain-containing protein [Cardiosporidium cionae]